MRPVSRTDLDEAAARGLLATGQVPPLWDFLSARHAAQAVPVADETPRFKPAHILYYLGGLLAIGAMTLFMTLGWELFGGGGLLAISLAYAAAALALTQLLLRRGLALPAGITAVLAVAMTPLALYGLQHVLGLWVDGDAPRAYRQYHTLVDWRWLLMEFGTLAAGVVALWRYRLPFLVMPVAVTLWYMSMDLAPFLFGGDSGAFFSAEGRRVSTAFGLCMVIVAMWVDLRTRSRRDFAFWLYLFGVLTFWGGLTAMDSSSEAGKFVYGCINVVLIAVGAVLLRRVFAVFGGLGLAFYLGHLSHTVFKDSLLFPFALTLIGLGVIGLGILWQRHEARIGHAMRRYLPAAWRERVEQRAGAA